MDAQYLETNPNLLVMGAEGNGVVYLDITSGQRFGVGRGVARLLDQLRNAAPHAAVAAGLPASGLDRLCDLGLIVSCPDGGVTGSGIPDREAGPGPGLFGCRKMAIGHALSDRSVQAVVVGMPYDVGVTGRPGCRFGPHYLRGASRTIFRPRFAGDTSGMFDPVRGRRVLSGVGLADIGDITADVHARNADTMDVLQRTTAEIALAGKLPVVLGGDHSLTLPAVRGVLAARPGLGVIHFDAHSDYRRPRTGNWREECHHGNFMDWLVGDPRVSCLVQLGVRQLVTDEITPNEKVTVWPGTSASAAGLDALLGTLPPEMPYYLTVDVDCLDALVMPSTGTPLPGGFGHAQLVDLIEGLCRARQVVGADLVEFLPDGNATTASVAADLILRILDGALHARDPAHRGT